MNSPVFTRTGVPGIGRIEVYAGGRIVLDGDLELDRPELAALAEAVISAGFAARDHATRPIRRATDVNDTLADLADHS